MSEITFELNGRRVAMAAAATLSLADLLRSKLGARSIHLGCEQGVCGACTILLDGRSVRSCLMLAAQVDGRAVTTAEGVAERYAELWGEIESTFLSEGAFQCGYCTSGMIVCLSELLDRRLRLTSAEIAERLSGQICRCTGYGPLRSAFESILEKVDLLVREGER